MLKNFSLAFSGLFLTNKGLLINQPENAGFVLQGSLPGCFSIIPGQSTPEANGFFSMKYANVLIKDSIH